MLLSVPMKKKFRFPFVKSCYNLYYNVIYNYSNKKLQKLLNFEPFSVLLDYFVKLGYMETMIKEYPTFYNNQAIYHENLTDMLEQIQSKV